MDIFGLLSDSERCAMHLGLVYLDLGEGCVSRHRAGKGFWYACRGKRITNKKRIAYYASLAIPPAWRDVWIAQEPNAYILVTGHDEGGRKQYIYHQEWLLGRELLQFYKLIDFGKALPRVRAWTREHLQASGIDMILAGMLQTLDTTAIRVGNQAYYEEHETVGLTTLRDEHVRVTADGVEFHFIGKSGQERHTLTQDPSLAKFYKKLLQERKGFLFPEVDSEKINDLLCDISKKHFSAKDFRTWGGTVWAYEALVQENATPIEAVDHAAEFLGNTRSVARTYYVHPHMLEASGDELYKQYFYQRKAPEGLLRPTEYNLLRLLKRLKKDRFGKV